jgi:hypothetical protein
MVRFGFFHITEPLTQGEAGATDPKARHLSVCASMARLHLSLIGDVVVFFQKQELALSLQI